MRPSSLAQAITEPDSDTDPIRAPSTPRTSVVVDGAAPTPENRSSSTTPIAAAEPPPMPLKIGRAHVCTPVTNAHLVCRLLLEKKNIPQQHHKYIKQHNIKNT